MSTAFCKSASAYTSVTVPGTMSQEPPRLRRDHRAVGLRVAQLWRSWFGFHGFTPAFSHARRDRPIVGILGVSTRAAGRFGFRLASVDLRTAELSTSAAPRIFLIRAIPFGVDRARSSRNPAGRSRYGRRMGPALSDRSKIRHPGPWCSVLCFGGRVDPDLARGDQRRPGESCSTRSDGSRPGPETPPCRPPRATGRQRCLDRGDGDGHHGRRLAGL